MWPGQKLLHYAAKHFLMEAISFSSPPLNQYNIRYLLI